MMVASVWLGWVAHCARVRRDAIATIYLAGGGVGYDWQWARYDPNPNAWERAMRWLVDLVGAETLGHPNFVELGDVGPDGPATDSSVGSPSVIGSLLPDLRRLTRVEILLLQRSDVTNDDLEEIADLTRITDLDLAGTRITDAGLAHVKGMTGLRSLNLNGTAVTDAGLTQLEGLNGLRWLGLRRTGVTEEGVGALLRVLPRVGVDFSRRRR